MHWLNFDEVLLGMKANYFCSFHLMCQFVWMFYRDEYSFHFQYQAEGMQSPARQDMAYYN